MGHCHKSKPAPRAVGCAARRVGEARHAARRASNARGRNGFMRVVMLRTCEMDEKTLDFVSFLILMQAAENGDPANAKWQILNGLRVATMLGMAQH